jgi:hypothetical protein
MTIRKPDSPVFGRSLYQTSQGLDDDLYLITLCSLRVIFFLNAKLVFWEFVV